ncbi:type II secretion system F family protein [bacterium]|nr:type II secretion system F family protein [bacterium]
MKFNFQARTKEGKLRIGVVEASSKDAALTMLQHSGLIVTSLEEKPLPFYLRKIGFLEEAGPKDLMLFVRQLAVMFRSKVPLTEALDTLSRQTKKKGFEEKIRKIKEEVEAGSSLSQALSRYPSVFSTFFVAVIRAGEASGKLSESLDYLADYLERSYEFSNKIKSAMTYPAFIFFFTLIIMGLMLTFVLPQLATTLKESGRELPTITVLVLGSGEFFRKNLLVLIFSLFLLFFIPFYLSKTSAGKKALDRVTLELPLIGSLAKKTYLVRISENLSTLILSGLPIVRALEITANVVGNEEYRRALLEARTAVRRGGTISTALSNHPDIFPPVFVQMTMVGERTGTLDSTLMNLVRFYQKEISRTIDSLLSLMEPILLICLGLGVAVFAIAVFVPIYQMMGSL